MKFRVAAIAFCGFALCGGNFPKPITPYDKLCQANFTLNLNTNSNRYMIGNPKVLDSASPARRAQVLNKARTELTAVSGEVDLIKSLDEDEQGAARQACVEWLERFNAQPGPSITICTKPGYPNPDHYPVCPADGTAPK